MAGVPWIIAKLVVSQAVKIAGTTYGGPAVGRAAQSGTRFLLNKIPVDSYMVEAVNSVGEPVVEAASDALHGVMDTVSEVTGPVIAVGEAAVGYIRDFFW